MTKEQFIEKIAPIIVKYASQYNILCPSAVIAQSVLESNGGMSELAVNAHNYFGLKYRPNRCPSACGIYYKNGSEQNKDGSYTTSAMKWMKFSNMENGVRGYFDFTNISTYKSIKGISDPKIYLENIKKAGYATSLKYVENLMNVIKSYDLTKYDIKNNNKEVISMVYKVAIDSGHFSNSAGKRSPEGYREHWINTNIAYYLDIALKRCGIETFKVAWNDKNGKDDLTDLSLTTRQKMIKNAKCDISISCHANAHGNGSTYTSAQGIETFIHSNSTKVKDSKALANKVQSYLIKGTKQTNRGVKSSDFAMCNCTAMGTKASILIEYGFMTNRYEEELMKTDKFCLECAEETAHGICDYLGVMYKNGNSTIVTPIIPTNNSTSSSTSFVHNGIDYSLVFNPTYYANKYSDLKKAFGVDSKKLFSHFCQYGMKEGRNGSATFNVQAYKNRYADLQKAFGNNLQEYYKHWIQYGHKEGRRAT